MIFLLIDSIINTYLTAKHKMSQQLANNLNFRQLYKALSLSHNYSPIFFLHQMQTNQITEKWGLEYLKPLKQ